VAFDILLHIFSDYDEVNAPKAMEAVPALCNLLQNSDTMVSMIIYDEKCV
jgi:E3 ubiquitin-protein ligase TRIP12